MITAQGRAFFAPFSLLSSFFICFKGVTRSQIEKVIIEPEQIVPGDMGVMVAQSRIWGGLIRVPFFEKENEIKILTLYWTSKFEKYWKENE